jgi:hypothetical protein
MARDNRIAAFRILLAVCLEDAATAVTTWARDVALQEARAARDALRNLGAVA